MLEAGEAVFCNLTSAGPFTHQPASCGVIKPVLEHLVGRGVAGTDGGIVLQPLVGVRLMGHPPAGSLPGQLHALLERHQPVILAEACAMRRLQRGDRPPRSDFTNYPY